MSPPDLDAARRGRRRPRRDPRTTSRPSRQRVGDAAMMTVVKADGYGHGLVESARGSPGRRRRLARARP